MAPKGDKKENDLQSSSVFRRIGHKGADAITPGNTMDSFVAAVEHGVDMIEIDVLKGREGRLVVAHDRQDALRRRPLDLTDALDAFLHPPLDEVELDFDLKLPGREAELAGALAGHDLFERSMVSTMEVESLMKLRQLEPELRLGWTYPKTRRDWTQYRWMAPVLLAGVATIRRRFPRELARRGPEMGIDAVWAYHRIVTPRLVEVAAETGVELIAWTVDDLEQMRELIAMGVQGICSNDPRLFERAEQAPAAEEETKPSWRERWVGRRAAKKAEKEAKKAEKETEKAEKETEKAAKAEQEKPAEEEKKTAKEAKDSKGDASEKEEGKDAKAGKASDQAKQDGGGAGKAEKKAAAG